MLYRYNEEIYISMIHLDAFNHPDLVANELALYQQEHPNGSYSIFIFKQKYYTTEEYTQSLLSTLNKRNIEYKIISLDDGVCSGIAVTLETVDVNTVKQIAASEISEWLAFKPDTTKYTVIRHPYEWALVLERKLLYKIENIAIKRVFTQYLIYNGDFWHSDVTTGTEELHSNLETFLESIHEDETIHDITERLHILFTKISKSAENIIQIKDTEREFLRSGALFAKVLKLQKKYEDHIVLKKIVDQNCRYLLNLFHGINPNPKLHILTPNIPEDEKRSVIEHCQLLIKAKHINDIDIATTLRVLQGYDGFTEFRRLFESQMIQYVYKMERKKTIQHIHQCGDIALEFYRKKDFKKAKTMYWTTVVYSKLCYCTPSNALTKAYYNYAATCQNAGEITKALTMLKIVSAMNDSLLKEDAENQELLKRKQKTIRRMIDLNVDIEH